MTRPYMILLALACCRGGLSQDFVIDTNVPGATAYLDGTKLGKVPVTLTQEQIQELGLVITEHVGDGFLGAQGLRVSTTTKENRLIWLQLPKKAQADYLKLETPWGSGTRHQYAKIGREKAVLELFPKAYNCGTLHFTAPKEVKAGAITDVRLKLVPDDPLVSTAEAPLAGFSFRSYDTYAWTNQPRKLPARWAGKVSPKGLEAAFKIKAPSEPGDYSLTASVGSYQIVGDPTGKNGGFAGAVRSDVKLIRVR